MRRARRGLSPLVATVVLISATILGGMLIYNYFQASVDKMQGLGEKLMVDASTVHLTGNTRLVHIEVLNSYDTDARIDSINGIYSNGTSIQLATQETLPIQVLPGDKASINAVVASPDIVAVSVTYTIDGKTLTTEPEKIR